MCLADTTRRMGTQRPRVTSDGVRGFMSTTAAPPTHPHVWGGGSEDDGGLGLFVTARPSPSPVPLPCTRDGGCSALGSPGRGPCSHGGPPRQILGSTRGVRAPFWRALEGLLPRVRGCEPDAAAECVGGGEGVRLPVGSCGHKPAGGGGGGGLAQGLGGWLC